MRFEPLSKREEMIGMEIPMDGAITYDMVDIVNDTLLLERRKIQGRTMSE